MNRWESRDRKNNKRKSLKNMNSFIKREDRNKNVKPVKIRRKISILKTDITNKAGETNV